MLNWKPSKVNSVKSVTIPLDSHAEAEWLSSVLETEGYRALALALTADKPLLVCEVAAEPRASFLLKNFKGI